jgi:tetratricopeptide (TPR) repeat protein
MSVSANEEKIKVYDAYGREMLVTKAVWRKDVLPGTIRKSWDDANALASIVIGALTDDFLPEALTAAEQLARIDSSARGACLYGIALMKNGRLDDAERVLQTSTREHGDDGSVLTNLAKVYAAKHDDRNAHATLLRALTVDPNQDNGLMWYVAGERERGGPPAERDALTRIANVPRSWRAQLFLARLELAAGNHDAANAFYRASLANAGRPVPNGLLMQMSGDLGNHGRLREIIAMVEPHFEVKTHGLSVGNNLIKAHLELGELDAARKILAELFSLQHAPWRTTLEYWDKEIANAGFAAAPSLDTSAIETSLLVVENPIWLSATSLALPLFPPRTNDAPVIAFLGSAAEVPVASARMELSDAPGRLSRALPLFLAEQLFCTTSARVTTLVPWVMKPSSGFLFAGTPWTDDLAVSAARPGTPAATYVVTIHLIAKSDPWNMTFRILRFSDAACLGTHSVDFSPNEPEVALRAFAQAARDALLRIAALSPQEQPAAYTVPQGSAFTSYLMHLEQLLATRCATMDGVGSHFLNAPRAIIETNLASCLQTPTNALVRIVFAETLAKMASSMPDVVREYREKVTMLQKDAPLSGPPADVVQRILASVFA